MTEPSAPKTAKTIHVRLRIAMYQQIAQRARQEQHPLSKEILLLLKQRLLAQASEPQAETLDTPSDHMAAGSTNTRRGTDAAQGA